MISASTRRKWTSVFSKASRKARRAGKPVSNLKVTQLEDRVTPATLFVDDDGATYPAGFTTIQAAVNASVDGDTIQVADGTYNENVLISKNNLKLLSDNGRTTTKIVGASTLNNGTVALFPGTTGVQIGDIGQGFHIVGIDGPTAGIEAGAVYVIAATYSNISIIGNEIQANGDHGLLADFGAVINGFTITDNIFSGQTFVGPNPAGSGFANQFGLANVPRQLVTIGNGGGAGLGSVTNLTFSNNQLTGTAGGISFTDNAGLPIAPPGVEQGNSLATIDASNSTITNNSFEGTTNRFGSALRVRRGGTTISGNNFDGDGMGAGTSFVFVQNNSPQSISDIFNANTFPDGAAFDAGTGTIVTVGGLQGVINAAAPGSTIIVAAGTYKGVTVPKPLTLIGAGIGQTILQGASPALIVNSPGVSISGISFTTATDDPTILIQNNGALTLRTSSVDESTGAFDRPGIRVDVGGLLDLGVVGDLGGNTININGAGSLIDNADDTGISALGNTWQQDAVTITDNFAIEDEINHALDAAGRGLVRYVAQNVYVTTNSGSIQRGIDASVSGDTVNVASGTYLQGATVTKPLTLLGAQAGVDARTRSGAESIVDFAGGAFGLAADGITVDGFTLQGQSNDNSGPGFGYAVYMASGGARTGGQVLNNIIQNNRAGIAVANTGAQQVVIQQNLFQNNSSGLATDIYADQFTTFGSATNILIDNNKFTNAALVVSSWAIGVSNTSATPFTNWTITNNDVTNHGRAAYFYNSSGFTVTGNTVDGTSNYAIGFFGINGVPANTGFTVSGNTLTNNLRGIFLADDAPGTAYAGTLTLTGNSYTTSGVQRSIENDSTTPVVATGDTFNTVLASGATTAQQYAIVDTIVDATDIAGLGHVSTRAANAFVTPNSFFAPSTTVANIQRAVDAIPAGGTVNVQAGSYTGDVSTAAASYTLSAGASPAQVTINGNLTLDANDTLPIEIGGLAAATDYDNFVVLGTVTLGGATLSVQQFAGFTVNPAVLQTYTIVDNDLLDPVTGIFAGLLEGSKITYAGGDLYISYAGGDGNDVVLSTQPLVIGTAGADTVTVTPTATGYDYQINANPVVSVVGAVPFNFNGLDGDDTLTAFLNANPNPAINYNGGTQTAPANAGNNAVFGDVLVVNSDGTHTVTYQGKGTSGAFDFAGTVAVMGGNTITFQQLEPVDIIGAAVANVTFANGADVVAVTNGLDSATNTLDAIVVTGTSGGVVFEQVHLRNNALVNINTVTGGSDGNDTVTVNSADNTHGNTALTINTGTGTDSVTFLGNATFAGAVAISTKSIAFNGGTLTAGTTATLTGGAGSSVTTNAAGLDLVAPTISITTSGVIGTAANRLEINATTLTFTTNGIDSAFLTDSAGGLQVNNSSVGAAKTIDLLVLGGNLTSVVDGTRDLGAQTLVLSVPNGTIGTGTAARLEINNALAGSSLTATTGGGDIFLHQINAGTTLAVANVNAGAGNVDILVNDGSITSVAGDAGVADIVGTNVTLRLAAAGRNLGVSTADRLEIDATLLQFITNTAATNKAWIVDVAGGLQVTDSSVGGVAGSLVNLLVQNGNLTSVTGGPRDLGGDIVIVATTGTGTIGTAVATPLEVNALTRFDATTANQNAFVLDTDLAFPLGLVNVGTGSAYLQSVASITDGNAAANNVAAASVAFVAATAVGAIGDAIETTVGGAAASAGTGGVFLANTGSLDLTTVNTVVGVTAGTTNVISTTTDLTVSQPVAAGTTTTLTFGTDNAGRTATVNAAINGTAASITGGTGADTITVNTSGTAPLTLNGGDAGDTYTVNVGTLNAAVSVVDGGAMGTDTLNVNGTAVANTFEVNTATNESKVVVDGTQTVNYTATVEVLNLDGADLGDTFNIFFTQGSGGSLLPATVNIVDTGATAGDVANVSGTDNADVLDVNYTATRTTSGLGSSITYTNGNLETLNVFSKASNDVVYAKAVNLIGGGPVVTLNGGSPSAPTPLPGDILILDVTGMAGLNTANIKAPAGSVPSTSHNLLSWTDFETIPTPIGLGGSFDFGTATSPVQAGPYVVPPPASYWVGVNGANVFPTKGYYGWNTPVNSYDRGNTSPNPAKTTYQNLLRDGNWFGPVNVARTFSVAAVAAGDYQVSITIGDTAVVMDNVYVTIEGSGQQLVPTVFQNQFITVTGIGSDTGPMDGKIDITFVDKGGTHSYWHVNAVDVRPIGLVSPVTITRADNMTTALVADGLTKTTYFADGFFPNAIATVSATNGTITTTDVDPFLVGVQVLADANGKATFQLQHPTGNATVTLAASAAVVVDAIGSFTQTFNLTPSQKIDFNTATTPTEPGYLGVGTKLYAGSATNGLGWLQAVQAGDRGAASGSALFRDFIFNFAGNANRGEFNIDLPTGATQAVTVYLGDPGTARDRLTVEAFNGSTYDVLATEIATSKTNSLTFNVTPVDLGGGIFQIRLRFGDLGGTQNGWSVQGIEYRDNQQTLGVTPTGAVAGDGTTVTNYTVTGGAINSLVTLNPQYGAVQGTDASTLYDGFQILLDGSGNGGFAIQSPVVAAGTLASAVALVAVNGSHAAGFTQGYTGAKVSYDFGPLAAPVAAGFKALPAATKATAQNGVGFTTTAGEFDRNPVSFPNVNKTATPDLFRDGVTGSGTGGFRVLSQVGATNVAVRVYAYDANSTVGNLTVTGEGGAKQTLPTSLTVPAVFDVVASDVNNDGFLDISIAGFSTWVMNGVEVG